MVLANFGGKKGKILQYWLFKCTDLLVFYLEYSWILDKQNKTHQYIKFDSEELETTI